MTYLLVDLVVLALCAVACTALLARSARRRRIAGTMAATALIVSAFTAVFDSLMIAAGLFTYAPEHLLGARVGLAPVEDFAYVLVAATLLPALWWGRGRRRSRDAR